MALSESQLQLLRLLKDRDSEQGVFFARWDEIRSAKYSERWIEANKNAPDLTWETQRLLLDLVEKGLVDELENWGTKEGKHYRITSSGIATLEAQQVPAILRHWPIVLRGLLWVILILAPVWLIYFFGPELGIIDFFEKVGAHSYD